MGHHRLRTAAGASPADPYFSSTTLLLLGNGTNGGQNNTFVDSSTNNFTITRNGNVTQGTFSPFTLAAGSEYSSSTNGGSGYFDGSGDYLTVPDNSVLDLGASDFTIECWIYPTGGSGSYRCITAKSDRDTAGGEGTFVIQLSNTEKASMFFSTGGSGWDLEATGTTSVSSNTWSHVAATRSGNTFKLFLNGNLEATVTSSITLSNNAEVVTIGCLGYTSGSFVSLFYGYISNLRILKGTALYTTTFTPPTSPLTAITNTSLLLNFTNGSIIDSTGKNDLETVGDAQISTSVKKYGTGSLKFDGTGDYIYSIAKDGTAFGTGDFTIEFWVYGLSSAARQDWLDLYNGTVANRIQIIWVSSQFSYYQNNTFVTGGGTYATSTWYHIALTRSSGSNRLFVNGTQVGTTATNTTNFSANSFYLGISNGGGTDFNGYIDDLRITKGVARYTSAFTPPSAQLPAR
jgi:hypothetical protein